MIIKNLKSFNLKQRFYKINIEFIFLLILLIITLVSLNFYNSQKDLKIEKWLNFLDNSYLKKTIDHALSSQKPRFVEVNYTIKLSAIGYLELHNSFGTNHYVIRYNK